MKYLATFYTHTGAVKYHRFLKNRGISAETLPVPRKYSSNCGIGVRFTTLEDINSLISEDIDNIFLEQEGNDRLIYNND